MIKYLPRPNSSIFEDVSVLENLPYVFLVPSDAIMIDPSEYPDGEVLEVFEHYNFDLFSLVRGKSNDKYYLQIWMDDFTKDNWSCLRYCYVELSIHKYYLLLMCDETLDNIVRSSKNIIISEDLATPDWRKCSNDDKHKNWLQYYSYYSTNDYKFLFKYVNPTALGTCFAELPSEWVLDKLPLEYKQEFIWKL